MDLRIQNTLREIRGLPLVTFAEAWAKSRIPPTRKEQQEEAELARLAEEAARREAVREARFKAGGPYWLDEEE
jgi:hypothetical protein